MLTSQQTAKSFALIVWVPTNYPSRSTTRLSAHASTCQSAQHRQCHRSTRCARSSGSASVHPAVNGCTAGSCTPPRPAQQARPGPPSWAGVVPDAVSTPVIRPGASTSSGSCAPSSPRASFGATGFRRRRTPPEKTETPDRTAAGWRGVGEPNDLRRRQPGEPGERGESVIGALPMRVDRGAAGGADDAAQDRGDDDGVVGVADERDEVWYQVQR